VLLKRCIRSSPEDFLRVFGELEPEPLEVAFGATYGWGWLADLLTDIDIPAHMSHPLATKAISSVRVKSDTVDATTLAHRLRPDLLPEPGIAPPEAWEARRLVRASSALVRMRSRLKCQVHVLLAEHGLALIVADTFCARGRAQIESLNLPAISQHRIDSALRLIDALSGEAELAETELCRHFAGDPRLKRLLPIPGRGIINAATEPIAAHSDRCSSRCSSTILTALSRTSCGYLVLLVIAPSCQRMESPAFPRRFRLLLCSHGHQMSAIGAGAEPQGRREWHRLRS
jgi:transposase